MSGVKWVQPGRALLTPDVRPRDIPSIVAQAITVAFNSPLPSKVMNALSSSMSAHPDVELAIYGYKGWGPLDGSLSFLAGFEHLRALSLALFELGGLEGLERFGHLRRLSVRHNAKLSLQVLASLNQLTYLSIDLPRVEVSVLSQLTRLRQLNMSARRGSIAPLAEHPSLERLWLHYGTERGLSPLASCKQLKDLSIWCIARLDEADLRPVGEIPNLDALTLGALRNVSTLEPLVNGRSRVRFLELEQLSSLDSLTPLARLPELRACTVFDSRPADRSLAALIDSPKLEEVFVGGSSPFPKHEVEQLAAAFAGRGMRYRALNTGREDMPRLGWRGLFGYADRVRAAH